MSTDPDSTSPGTTPTAFDQRIEDTCGHSLSTLREYRNLSLLTDAKARIVDAHHALCAAERSLTYQRRRLHRLLADDVRIEEPTLVRIRRALGALEQASALREACESAVRRELRAAEHAAEQRQPQLARLSRQDFAALLAIARGATLRENILTQRLSVSTAAGSRIPYAVLQRLERAGLVTRDDSHPLHAGQPLTVTAAGRSALSGTRRPETTVNPGVPAPSRPGAWPTDARTRR
jgi:hypothetical protein